MYLSAIGADYTCVVKYSRPDMGGYSYILSPVFAMAWNRDFLWRMSEKIGLYAFIINFFG